MSHRKKRKPSVAEHLTHSIIFAFCLGWNLDGLHHATNMLWLLCPDHVSAFGRSGRVLQQPFQKDNESVQARWVCNGCQFSVVTWTRWALRSGCRLKLQPFAAEWSNAIRLTIEFSVYVLDSTTSLDTKLDSCSLAGNTGNVARPVVIQRRCFLTSTGGSKCLLIHPLRWNKYQAFFNRVCWE